MYILQNEKPISKSSIICLKRKEAMAIGISYYLIIKVGETGVINVLVGIFVSRLSKISKFESPWK